MSLFLVVIGTIVVVEVVHHLRTNYRKCRIEIVTTAMESIKTIRSKTIPETSKEKILQRCAAKLFVQSGILFGLILLTMSPLGVIITVDTINGGNVLQMFFAPSGILVSILAAAFYTVSRKRIIHG